MINPYIISYIPILSLSLIYFLYIIKKGSSIRTFQFFFITSFYFFVAGSGNWAVANISLDQGQWFIAGKSMFENFQLWHDMFALADHGRFFTILFYGLFWKLGISDAALIGHILVLLSYLTLLYTSIRILEKEISNTSIYTGIGFFTIIISSFSKIDFWNFNSEHITITFIMIAFHFLFKSLKSSDNQKSQILLSGIFLTFTPFCKEQFALIAIGCFLTISSYLLLKKQYSLIISFIIGSCLSTFSIWLICLSNFSFKDIISLYNIGAEYKNRDLITQEFIYFNWNTAYNFFKLVYYNWHYFLFNIFLFFFLISVFQSRKFNSFLQIIISTYYILALLTILLSYKFPFHYSVFLFPSFLYFSVFSIDLIKKVKSQILVSIFIFVTITPLLSKEMKSIYPIKGFSNFNTNLESNETYKILKDNIPPNKKVLLWGWANQYLVGLNSIRCTSFLYPQFAMKKIPTSNLVGSIYLSEITLNKPDYIIELLGPNQFFTTDTSLHSIKYNQYEIYNYIKIYYRIIKKQDEVTIYKKITNS